MNKKIKWIGLLLICIMLAGCSNIDNTQQGEKKLETGFIPARAGMYDSADTAVIKHINISKQTITLFTVPRQTN